MIRNVSLSIWMVAGLMLAGCQDVGDRKLPVLGNKEVKQRQENGRAVYDTAYHTIPDFRFVNQDSVWVTPETFENKIYVADFFFTTCPTICPVMKTQMLRVYEAFEDNPEVAFLSHSIDPEYDSVATLRKFAEGLGVESSKWHFVTGNKKDIYNIGQKSYLVSAQEDKDAPGGFLHSGAFILIDKDKRIRGYYDGTEKEAVDQLIADIPVLLREYEKE